MFNRRNLLQLLAISPLGYFLKFDTPADGLEVADQHSLGLTRKEVDVWGTRVFHLQGTFYSLTCSEEETYEEFKFLFSHILHLDLLIVKVIDSLLAGGDWFGEIIASLEQPEKGILKIQQLPQHTVYRIETTAGKLLEFQQGAEAPNYQLLGQPFSELDNVLRFSPHSIIHLKILGNKRSYPYGRGVLKVQVSNEEVAKELRLQISTLVERIVIQHLTLRAPNLRGNISVASHLSQEMLRFFYHSSV